jgi:hypothetical protein
MNQAEYLSPYPFYAQEKEVFVKILPSLPLNTDTEYFSSDTAMEYQLTLLNRKMLNFDLEAFNSENTANSDARPYFYEFFTEVESRETIAFLEEHIGQWLQAEFVENEGKKTEGYLVEGTVLFSSSPFKTEKTSIVIKNSSVPKSIKSQILSAYDTTGAIADLRDPRHYDLENVLDLHTASFFKEIRIYNVGQANCIYLKNTANKRVLFDIGVSNKISDITCPYEKKSLNALKHIQPNLVILSHWDLDHILGVCYSSDRLFECHWIAPDLNALGPSTPVSAARLAKFLHWKRKLFLVGQSFANIRIYRNAGFELWMGKCKQGSLSKANNSGLIITLYNGNSALLPGDCEYNMLPNAIGIQSHFYEYIVVPHHCSKIDFPHTYLLPKWGKKCYAIVSVGDNTYGHPNSRHIRELHDLGYQIEYTVGKNHYIYIPNLSNLRLVTKKGGHTTYPRYSYCSRMIYPYLI